MTLGFDLVVSSNSGVSSFSLLLDEAVVLPKLGAKGVIISGVLSDVNCVVEVERGSFGIVVSRNDSIDNAKVRVLSERW